MHDRTVLSVQHIIQLLGFCLHNTYFSFQEKFYEQIEGTTMGSLVNPIVANLYMEYFEREPIHSASTPRYWYRFVDDTFVIQQQSNKQLFLDHINRIDPVIKLTVVGNQKNGSIPFLDTVVKLEVDNFLSITVYPKPTHRAQYLQWDRHHNLSAKYSVRSTLTHRAKTVHTRPELLNEELEHLKEALVKCKYSMWAIQKVQNKYINNNWEEDGNKNNNQENPMQDTHRPSDSTEERPPREQQMQAT